MQLWADLAYFIWQVLQPIAWEIGATIGGLAFLILVLVWIRSILTRGLS